MPGDPLLGTGQVNRTLLTYAQLMSAQTPPAPVSDDGFALPAQAAQPRHEFQGKLTLTAPGAAGMFGELRDDYGYTSDASTPRKHLPDIAVELVQNGSHLIPVTQGLVISGNPTWNYIIGTGRAWHEDGDQGWTRASLPFALVERNQNCTHNGLMTFLYNTTSVSQVRYQITQETCLYFKFDMWGQLSATTVRYAVDHADRLIADHASEIVHLMPTKPVATLATDFPSSGVEVAGFTRDIVGQDHITTWGVVVNGVNYTSDCPTRTGKYPFCNQMRLPSYSTAKSVLGAVALMRLGALHGTEVYASLIRDHVPQYTAGGSWTDVTFDNAADMATGNYRDPGYQVDEVGTQEAGFLLAEPYNQKITQAFAGFPSKAAPGTHWVYHSHDIFILTQAMTHMLGGDVFERVRSEVYAPIGVSRGGQTALRTDNSASGAVIGSWGLFYDQDDIAKISNFLNTSHGVIAGVQVLEPTRLAEALFRGGDDGLPVDDGVNPVVPGALRYSDGFWGKRMTPTEFPEYPCEFKVARMGGYGGISILLMPNGTVYYVFSDNDEFGWYNAVSESNKLVPQCPATARAGNSL